MKGCVMTCWLRGIAVAAMLGFGAISLMDVAAHAEPGVFDDRIVFGQSAAFDGPAAALGLGMREGILASFNEANATGGVNGHRLELVSYDDGYKPEKAIANTKRLIDENGVFALVGEVGTPTSNAVQPIATEAGVPFIGPFTGAAFLRNPSLGNVINIRGSYDQETEAWIEHLTTDLGVSRIATDNELGGVKAADALKQLGVTGKVLVISTDPGVSSVDARVAGMEAAGQRAHLFGVGRRQGQGLAYRFLGQCDRALRSANGEIQRVPDVGPVVAKQVAAYFRDADNAAVVDRKEYGHLVATERIITVGTMAGAGERAGIPRPLDVVEDHLLVEIAQFAHSRNTSRTVLRPATRASTSSRSL